jgi:hypothetical protein
VRPPEEVVSLLTDPAQQSRYRGMHVEMTDADAFRHWHEVVAAASDMERAFGCEAVLRMTRGELLSDPESALRRVFEFLGEPFDPRTLRVLRDLPAPAEALERAGRAAFVEQRCPTELRSAVLALADASLSPQRPSQGDVLLETQLEERFNASVDVGLEGEGAGRGVKPRFAVRASVTSLLARLRSARRSG